MNHYVIFKLLLLCSLQYSYKEWIHLWNSCIIITLSKLWLPFTDWEVKRICFCILWVPKRCIRCQRWMHRHGDWWQEDQSRLFHHQAPAYAHPGDLHGETHHVSVLLLQYILLSFIWYSEDSGDKSWWLLIFFVIVHNI